MNVPQGGEPILVILSSIHAELRVISAKLATPCERSSVDRNWLTIKQAAAAGAVGPKIIRRAITTGALPATNISASSRRPTWRIAKAAFDEFMLARTASGAAPAVRARARYKSRHFDDL